MCESSTHFISLDILAPLVKHIHSKKLFSSLLDHTPFPSQFEDVWSLWRRENVEANWQSHCVERFSSCEFFLSPCERYNGRPSCGPWHWSLPTRLALNSLKHSSTSLYCLHHPLESTSACTFCPARCCASICFPLVAVFGVLCLLVLCSQGWSDGFQKWDSGARRMVIFGSGSPSCEGLRCAAVFAVLTITNEFINV